MFLRLALVLGLATLMFGCGAGTPNSAAPQENPTVAIPATAVIVAGSEETATLPALGTPVERVTPAADPTATPTLAPTNTPEPEPTATPVQALSCEVVPATDIDFNDADALAGHCFRVEGEGKLIAIEGVKEPFFNLSGYAFYYEGSGRRGTVKVVLGECEVPDGEQAAFIVTGASVHETDRYWLIKSTCVRTESPGSK